MPRKPPAAKQDDPKQSARFIEAAKKAGGYKTPKAFDKAFKKVVPKA